MTSINGVNIPGQWLTKEYIASRQANWWGAEPKFNICNDCSQLWLKTHYCPFSSSQQKETKETNGTLL